MNSIFSDLQTKSKESKKSLAILIDPDKVTEENIERLVDQAEIAQLDYFFLGGSLLLKNQTENVLNWIKKRTQIPVILFPGSGYQLVAGADAILFLSLISGRNPDLLIGQQVHAAPLLKELNFEIIPTGYILVECGITTTAIYMSQTMPIPANKSYIAAVTALAGEMLGLKMMYLDAGSGSNSTISNEMIQAVREQVKCPIIVGGGIRTPQKAKEIANCGADIIVVGTAFENLDFEFKIKDFKDALN